MFGKKYTANKISIDKDGRVTIVMKFSGDEDKTQAPFSCELPEGGSVETREVTFYNNGKVANIRVLSGSPQNLPSQVLLPGMPGYKELPAKEK